MPRLLLVDDNPSIHKIAETLLAPTDIQLVCVESAKDALNLITQGERFDVALLDTVMAGTDGWELLDQLRMHPATAGIPIAMMAGVLDTVDPARLEKAPIQGFLKKPVELRDLGDRVHKFLETRVEVAPPPPPMQDFSPFSTLPAVKLADLPEFRKPAAPEPSGESTPEPVEDDLLLLVEADLWPEVPPPPGTVTEDLSPFAEIPPEEALDLEELDLDSLKGLTIDPKSGFVEPVADVPEPVPSAPVSAAMPVPERAAELDPEPFPEELASVPTQILPEDTDTHELPDLGPEAEPTFDPSALAGLDSLSDEAFAPLANREPFQESLTPDPDFLSGLGEASITPGVAVVGWSDESERMLGYLTPSKPLDPSPALEANDGEDELDLGELEPLPEPLPVPAAGFPLAEPSEPWSSGELPVLAAAAALPVAALAVHDSAPAPVPASPTENPPTPLPVPAPAGTAASPAAEELLRAIASDPALMDQLAKALVAKLSDQVLREIAWEVMPEMAERLNRH